MTDTHQGAVGDARKRLTDAQTPATAPNSPRLDLDAIAAIRERLAGCDVWQTYEGMLGAVFKCRRCGELAGTSALDAVRRHDETIWRAALDAATARADALAAKVQRVERLIANLQQHALPGMTDWEYAEDFRTALADPAGDPS